MRGAVAGPRTPLGWLAIVAYGLLAVAGIGYLLASQGVKAPGLDHRYRLEVAFPDAGGLKTENHNPVTVAGVTLGEVERVRYSGGRAVATLRMEQESEGRIFRDARASVVPRSALNDLTVDIAPGRRARGALGDGDRLRPAPDAAPVGSDQVIDTLDADTRAQVQILLGELSVGLKGRPGELQRAVASLGDASASGRRVSGQLARRRVLLARLVTDLDRVLGALGDRGTHLADSIEYGRRTLDAVSAREPELRATLRQLPATLASLSTAMDEVTALSGPAVPALERLRPTARALPAGLRSLREFTPSARRLLREADPLVTRGRAPARDLRTALRELRLGSTALRPAVRDTLPLVRAIDKNKEGVGLLGERFSGVFSTNDANGPILRGLGFFEDINPRNLGFPANPTAAQRAQMTTQSVEALTRLCESNALACVARYLIPGLPGAVRP